MFRVLIIHNLVVREIRHGNELTVGPDGGALALQNIMAAGIVTVAVEHFLTRRGALPGGQLLSVELELGKRPARPQPQIKKLLLNRLFEKGQRSHLLKTESRRREGRANKIPYIVHRVVVRFQRPVFGGLFIPAIQAELSNAVCAAIANENVAGV